MKKTAFNELLQGVSEAGAVLRKMKTIEEKKAYARAYRQSHKKEIQAKQRECRLRRLSHYKQIELDNARKRLGRNVSQGMPPLSAEERCARARAALGPVSYIKRSVTARAQGEMHPLALAWSLQSPDGRIWQFCNLADFIRNHQELFTPEQLLFHGKRRGTEQQQTKAQVRLGRLCPRRKTIQNTAFGWRWHINQEKLSYLADDAVPANISFQAVKSCLEIINTRLSA